MALKTEPSDVRSPFERFSEALHSYQRFSGRLSTLDEVEQEDVDRLYAAMGTAPDQVLPKKPALVS